MLPNQPHSPETARTRSVRFGGHQGPAPLCRPAPSPGGTPSSERMSAARGSTVGVPDDVSTGENSRCWTWLAIREPHGSRWTVVGVCRQQEVRPAGSRMAAVRVGAVDRGRVRLDKCPACSTWNMEVGACVACRVSTAGVRRRCGDWSGSVDEGACRRTLSLTVPRRRSGVCRQQEISTIWVGGWCGVCVGVSPSWPL